MKVEFHKEFNIEHQYQLYLSRVDLHEDKMHPQQKYQVKMAFYGGIGQLLILMRDDLTKLTEDQGARILEQMWNEVTEYIKKL